MQRHALSLVAVLALSLTVSGCGGGGIAPAPGGDPLPPPAPLTITTTSLPSIAPGQAYPPTQLEASGAQGALTWRVAVGALPNGIDLAADGVLQGTPTGTGAFDFTVEASDPVGSATQALQIVVSDFQATVSAGLVFGDAWTDQAVTITTVGSAGAVTFEVANNTSGGALSDVNQPAGTATYTPGATDAVTDVVDVTDTGSGTTISIRLDVRKHPTVNHTARFGTTDVWWIESDVKRGSHAYSTDLHKSLVDIGFWPAATTGVASNDFERLIEMLVRVQILREVNLIYLREADGSKGTVGLDISFPFDEPDTTTYTAPNPGNTLAGSSTRYSVMEFADAVGQPAGVLGVAFVDANNDRHENDGGDGLGVLTDRVTGSFSNRQGTRLIDDDPLTAADVPILEALLYEEPMSGARYDEIKTLLEYWSRAMAIVTAHEVGHSLGLEHNGQSGTLLNDSVSFATGNLSTSNAVALTTAEVTTLQSDLPGPGKTAASTSAAVEAPGEDAHVLVVDPN